MMTHFSLSATSGALPLPESAGFEIGLVVIASEKDSLAGVLFMGEAPLSVFWLEFGSLTWVHRSIFPASACFRLSIYCFLFFSFVFRTFRGNFGPGFLFFLFRGTSFAWHAVCYPLEPCKPVLILNGVE